LLISRQNPSDQRYPGITCKANEIVVEFYDAVSRRVLEILNPCLRNARAFAFVDEDSKGS